jgi:hypothetical protein
MMSPEPDFSGNLRQLDGHYLQLARESAPRLTAAGSLRGAKLRQRGARLALLTFAAGAAAVLATLGWFSRSPAIGPVDERPRIELGSLAFALDPECRASSTSGPVRFTPGCELSGPALSIQALSRIELEAEGPRLQVRSGDVLFDVAPRKAQAEPLRVVVSHGVIEIVGTRFLIQQREHDGRVDLYEGQIRFIDERGDVTMLAPGQSQAWPAPRPPAQAPVPAASEAVASPATATGPAKASAQRAKPRGTKAKPFDLAQTLADVDALQREAQHEQAVDRLEKALRRDLPQRTQQILHFELGRMLQDDLHRAREACAHWREHLARFPGGVYGREVRANVARPSCKQEDPSTDPGSGG